MEPARFTSVADAHEWMARQFGEWPDRPTAEHLAALTAYKGVDFSAINEALREEDATRFDAPQYLAITEAIAAESITEPVEVFRGIDDPEIVELALYADAIPHEGFVSVSLVGHVAQGFLSQWTDDTQLLLIATLPIGTQAAPLDLLPEAPNAGEAELLLHAGSTFVIDTIDGDEDADLITARGHWRFP